MAKHLFQGIEKLYGEDKLKSLSELRVAVIGVGGVGSWTAEILARSGVGHLTLIDLDDICISNSNRQIHTLQSTIGKSKVHVLKDRLIEINPSVQVKVIEDFVTTKNLDETVKDIDYVVDAIDGVKTKAYLIDHCIRHKIPLVTTGAAGGKTNPAQIRIDDLGNTQNDMLLKRVRRVLRRELGYEKGLSQFKVASVYSYEKVVLPKGCHLDNGGKLDCSNSLGSAGFVTGAIGMTAASVVINNVTGREIGPN
jgi:tRNA A37 threonylcarbamoyladenosine dehydratase